MHHCPLCAFTSDDPAAMFAHLTDYRAPGHNYDNATKVVAKAAGLKYEAGFRDAAGEYDVGGLKVTVHPAKLQHGPELPRSRQSYSSRHSSVGRKSAQHRIYVECPTCHKDIPAGRIHQHLIVHGPRTRVCDQCGKTYGSGNHLRAHKRREHGGQ